MKTPLTRIRLGAISLVGVVIAGVLSFRLIGNYDWVESLWMVVVTISTVGFGERSTQPAAIQLVTITLILFGVTAAAYVGTGIIQLALEGEVDRVLGRQKMTREISKLREHVIICGFGRLGNDLANQLSFRGLPYVVVDIDPEKILEANEQKFLSVTGDATSESVLQEASLEHARALVTALPTDAENVFITLTARNLRPDIQILAKAERESSCGKLRQAGANKIIMPHRVGAQQMERMISRPTTADMVELFAEATHLDMELDELLVGPESRLADKTLGESGIRESFNLLIIGIKNQAGQLHFNPGPQQPIVAGDTLLVIGPMADINRMKAES